MANIRSNLQSILDERGISVLQFSKQIDYRYESVRQVYNDTNAHFPRKLILKICEELNVTPGDLIIYEKEQSE